MKKVILTIGFAFSLCVSAGAQARPVSYPDGVMVMGMADHMLDSAAVSYSPTARDAIGLRTDYLREDADWLKLITYNRLLKRWNGSDSQANLFLLGGAGVASNGREDSAAATLGMEIDWETRRYYLSYENRGIMAGDVEQAFTQKARVGIAPYIGGYDDVHSWLMLQVDHHPSERDNVVFTPMLRLFNQSAMGEFGISHRKDVMLNVTFQF